MAINWTEAEISKVVSAVMQSLGALPSPAAPSSWDASSFEGRKFIGVYDDMNDAIDAGVHAATDEPDFSQM